MPFGFRFGEGIKLYLKRSMLPCFFLLESWRRNAASLQGLPECGKSRKRALHVRTFFFFTNSIPVILQWHKSYIAWMGVNVCKTSADTQKTVLGKNDQDVYECKYERSFTNLTVLSVRLIWRFNLSFLLMVVVRGVLARLGISLVGKRGSVVLPNVIKTEKNCLLEFLNKVKSNTLIFTN